MDSTNSIKLFFFSGAFGADWTERVLNTVMFPPICHSTEDASVSQSQKVEGEMQKEESGSIKMKLDINESKSEKNVIESGLKSELESEKEIEKGEQKEEDKEEGKRELEGSVPARFIPSVVTFVTGNAKKLEEVKDILLTYKTSFKLISEKVIK